MKQVIQSLSSGVIEVEDIPAPVARPGTVVIATSRSLISPGTERMLRDFGRASLVGKAMQQPHRVKEVLNKVMTDGLSTTYEAVQSKLVQPVALGYCNVGRVIALGAGVEGLSIGDRVISNGAHAEIVRVPRNLVVRVPGNVDDDDAVFTVLASIALQGIRLSAPTLGECVAVIGLGLVGLLAVQLLRAQGVEVLGIDINPQRCELARTFGAQAVCPSEGEDPLAWALQISRGRGMDAVLICAATKSNDPIEQAAKMARAKGRIVLVGVVGLNVPRDEFYHKELSFQVSCSYGPGRYDPSYEDEGHDYPVGHVRWTEQRNFEAVLDMMASGRLDLQPFINARYSLAEAATAYTKLDSVGDVLGMVLEYAPVVDASAPQTRSVNITANAAPIAGTIHLGVIGAGNYATRQLIPSFKRAGAALQCIVTDGGVSAVHAARQAGFARAASDFSEFSARGDIDLAVVATRHDSHAQYIVDALNGGLAVFTEKPLALTKDELDRITTAYESSRRKFVMVGFNRRFSAFIKPIKTALVASSVPPAIMMTINAGAIPGAHWTQKREIGGGRIIGEACHFVDLARYLAGAPIVSVQGVSLGRVPGDANPEDKAVITLSFANGAVANIQYLANGHKSFPKERVEVFCGGKIWRIDNFRKLQGFGTAGLKSGLFGKQDKGQDEMARLVVAALRRGTAAPIPFEELLEVAAVMIDLDQQLLGR